METIDAVLKKFPVVLASGSPRRVHMLRDYGANPIVIKPNCDEEITTSLNPEQMVMALALRKAMSVVSTAEKLPDDCILMASDTTVALGNVELGKPAGKEDAFKMLDSLRGKMHTVYTGVCLWRKDYLRVFTDHTDVYFKNYSDKFIWDYIATGSPLDKAGAYGIQDKDFCSQVEKICGNEDTVIGLPLTSILQILKQDFADGK